VAVIAVGDEQVEEPSGRSSTRRRPCHRHGSIWSLARSNQWIRDRLDGARASEQNANPIPTNWRVAAFFFTLLVGFWFFRISLLQLKYSCLWIFPEDHAKKKQAALVGAKTFAMQLLETREI
jgi:hypothetical protein